MHIHVDPLGGLAGDMFLAAVVDAGILAPDSVEAVLRKLDLGPAQIETKETRRGAISGTHLQFVEESRERESVNGGAPTVQDPPHRDLSSILDLLRQSGLSDGVRDRTMRMFETLGEVESQIHGIPREQVHFHEVGALDSIFDFVAAAWVIEETNATWSVAPISVGQGTTETDHGSIPVPVPATAELLHDFDLVPRDVQAELVTPTGATILSILRQEDRLDPRPSGQIQAVGYGAGTRQFSTLSNVVRFTCIEPSANSHDREIEDEVCRLSCDLDDMTPEALAHVEEQLLASGALDVVRQAVSMKKGRQGARLSVLCRPEDRDEIVEFLLRETTTFGLRDETVRRVKLARTKREVDTPFGPVSVKIGVWNNKPLKASPEYSDCAARAAENDVPLREVYHAARKAGHQLLDSGSFESLEFESLEI